MKVNNTDLANYASLICVVNHPVIVDEISFYTTLTLEEFVRPTMKFEN